MYQTGTSLTREGLDYEFTVVLELDLKHQALVSKDRTGLFMDKPPFIITSGTGKIIREWCSKEVVHSNTPQPERSSINNLNLTEHGTSTG